MRIPVDIHKKNLKFTVIVKPKNACKSGLQITYGYHFLTNHCLALYFFSIITIKIYHIMVLKWKHVMVPMDIFIFNEELESLSTSIIGIININASSHENTIVIFITKKG